MWVFDGEEWTQDNGEVETTSKPKSSQPQPWPVELVPELQVIEIVQHEVPETRYIPVPLP